MDDLTALALAAGRGDRVAETAFVRAVQRDVWQLAAHLADAGAADDLAQDALVRVIRALPSFRGESSARAWALAITRRAVADHLRRAYRWRRALARLGSPDLTVPDGTDRAAIRAALAALDDDRRAAFVLTQIVGLSYEEAAIACACAVGTIRSRVARARTELALALGDGAAGQARSHR